MLCFFMHPCPLLHSSLLAQQESPSSVSDQRHPVATHRKLLLRCHHILTWGVCLYYCDVERDCPQADGDEPAGDWATSHGSVHDVLVNKKSNAMLVFIFCPTEENLVSFICSCFANVLPSHFKESKEIPFVAVHSVC